MITNLNIIIESYKPYPYLSYVFRGRVPGVVVPSYAAGFQYIPGKLVVYDPSSLGHETIICAQCPSISLLRFGTQQPIYRVLLFRGISLDWFKKHLSD